MWQLTAKDRFVRALRKVVDFVREHRHMKIKDQHRLLCLKVKGHYGYFGLTGNIRRVSAFRKAVRSAWFTWLNRRAQMPSFTGGVRSAGKAMAAPSALSSTVSLPSPSKGLAQPEHFGTSSWGFFESFTRSGQEVGTTRRVASQAP